MTISQNPCGAWRPRRASFFKNSVLMFVLSSLRVTMKMNPVRAQSASVVEH
jgi:hypothetical protein